MLRKLAAMAAISAAVALAACVSPPPTPEERLQSNGIKYANGSVDPFGYFSFDIPGSTCTGKIGFSGRLEVYDGTPRTIIATFEAYALSSVVNDAATRHCFKEEK